VEKIAPADYPVLDLIARRWSPRAFSNRSVSEDDLHRLFEAARWAPSNYNEQPYRFFYATKADTEFYHLILSCLSEKNQSWARTAPVLLITAAKLTFDHNGKPNRHAWYDVGQAVSYLTFQAMSMGIFVHQMAGFSATHAREVLNLPQEIEPVTAVAIGYPGDPDELPEKYQIKERAPRFRHRQDEFVLTGKYT
jgi:nitroreductase